MRVYDEDFVNTRSVYRSDYIGKKSLSIKRERDVIEEIEKYKDIQIEFHAYNVEEGTENDGQTN